MRKIIIIRSKAQGLGILLKKGAESHLSELPPPDPQKPDKRRKCILITPEGSSDSYEKTVQQVLSDQSLTEREKPGKKVRHLKQLFTRALASGADVVIIDNSNGIVVSEDDCTSDGKTFEYDEIQFMSTEEIIANGKEEELEKSTTKRNGNFFDFLKQKKKRALG